MSPPRPRVAPPTGSDRPTDRTTEELVRALDRRHHLDEQQRALRDAIPPPHFTRPRPPG